MQRGRVERLEATPSDSDSSISSGPEFVSLKLILGHDGGVGSL
jgi:hypothetical protein